jgi:hypothetical protein
MVFNSTINIITIERVNKRLKKILSRVDPGDKFSLIKTFYRNSKNDHIWLRDNVGCDWIILDGNLNIKSCDFLPISFFSHLYNFIYRYDKNCIIEVRFKHESNEPVGAILFKDCHYIVNEYDFESDDEDDIINDKINHLLRVCYDEIDTEFKEISYKEK